MRILVLLFIAMPILEMWLLITVGRHIGALTTVGLVVLTAAVGLALLRQQGLSTLWRARQRLDSGELPAREIAEGLLLAVGGALLLTPGFVTDGIGFCCLVPGLRQVLIRHLIKHFTVVQTSNFHAHYRNGQPQDRQQGAGRVGGDVGKEPGETIEGEFKRHD